MPRGLRAHVEEVGLFMSSYTPLFVILAVRFETRWLIIGSSLLALIGARATVAFVRAATVVRAAPLRVQRAESQTAAVAGYFASYVLPFVIIPHPTTRDLIGYGIFLTVTAIIYIRAEMIDVNPTLLLFGYKLYSVATADGWTGHLLSKSTIPRGTAIAAVRFRDQFLVVAKDERDTEEGHHATA